MSGNTSNEAAPKPLRFLVKEGIKSDFGKSLVRIPTTWFDKLDIETSDVVSVVGKGHTVATVLPARPDDGQEATVRMDSLVRQNAKASLNDFVEIAKIRVSPADKISIAPLDSKLRIAANEQMLQRKLKNRVVSRGDILTLNVPTREHINAPREIEFVAKLFQGGATMPSRDVKVQVTSTIPTSPAVEITEATTIQLTEMPESLRGIPNISYDDIGGMHDAITRVREMIELPLNHPELFEQLGIEPPKGVLLWGPPGTGKTLLAQAVANESNAYFTSINGPEIMSKFYGESEQRLRELFEEAEKNAPAILFIDELDSIAPKREEVTGEVERRVVAQLLSVMDGMQARGKVVVIAATNRPNAVDPALRRPGRFDREVEVGIPDQKELMEIFLIHSRGMPLGEDVDLEAVVQRTHGYVGADIAALCREAAMLTLRRYLPEMDLEEDTVPPELLRKMRVIQGDFIGALRHVQPSALREITMRIPEVGWDDVGGIDKVKQILRELIEWPMKYPESFKSQGIRPPTGILLFGAPGTGKTLLAKAVANEINANFVSLKGPEILSKFVGESEKAIRELFRKARQAAPTVLFLDEIDAITPLRGSRTGSGVTETVVNQILTELDGIEEMQGVVVLAASNRPDIIDPALLRAGRFDRHLLIPTPDKDGREEILKVHTRLMTMAEDISLKELAKRTEGFVGADIENLCTEAVIESMRRDIKQPLVLQDDFEEALSVIHPTVTEEVVESYNELDKRLRRKRSPKSSTKSRSDFV